MLSTHLARSYHHLFPLINWVDLSGPEVVKATNLNIRFDDSQCFACRLKFPKGTSDSLANQKKASTEESGSNHFDQIGATSRFMCLLCKNVFCIDCELFAHNVLHNCPGCESQFLLEE